MVGFNLLDLIPIKQFLNPNAQTRGVELHITDPKHHLPAFGRLYPGRQVLPRMIPGTLNIVN